MAFITWTEFLSAAADRKIEHEQEWADVIRHLQAAPEFGSKAQCPWLKLARFGPTPTSRGSLRHNANVVEIYGVEGDYDGGAMQPEHAIMLLERAGIRATVYTSPSHTPDRPRWRVLAPLSRAAGPKDHSRYLARVNGALGGVLGSESFTLSQSYYYGRIAGAVEYLVLATWDDPDEGEFVDLLDQLDAIAVVSSPLPPDKQDIPPGHAIAAAVEHLGRRLRTGDNRRELLRRYVGDKSRRGLDADEIMHLVGHVAERYFDRADGLDTANVRRMVEDFVTADYLSGSSASPQFGGVALPVAPSDLVMTVEQLDKASSAVSWAVKGLIPERSIGFMFGASGTFKSFLALDYALHRTYGMRWLGRRTKAAQVVYLAAEGGTGLIRRIKAWHKDRHMIWEDCTLRVVVVPMTLKTQAAALKDAIEKAGVQPGDVIVDTMSQTFSGNENSNDEVADWMRVIGTQLRDALACTVMVLHHSGHSALERPRGASAIIANADFALGVFRDERQMLATIEAHKVKDGEIPPPANFELRRVELGFDEDGDVITSLSATYIDENGLTEALKREVLSGRGGKNQLLVRLAEAHEGGMERELKKIFADECGITNPESIAKAYWRSRKWATENGFLEFAQGRVIVLRRGQDGE